MRRLAAAALTFTLAACADPSTVGQDPSGSPSPTLAYAANTVVLQMFHTGGLLPPDHLPDLPSWTLYGDGRVFTLGPVPAIYPGPALENVQVARVSRSTVSRLVEEAQAAGIDGKPRDYGQPAVADAGSTVFRLTTEDGTVETSVYALGFADGVDNEARERLRVFAERLTDLNGWLGAGTVGAEASYDPAGIAVFAQPYRQIDGDPDQEPVDWNGPRLTDGATTEAGLCTVVSGVTLDALLGAFRKANQRTPWTHDGTQWSLRLRTLLPGERTCTDAYTQ